MERLNILTIPKWYPSEVHSKSGIFVEDLAKALSLRHNVTVLFVYPSPHKIKSFHEVQIEEKDGLRVIRARYRSFIPLPGILEAALFNWWTERIFRKVLAPTYKPDIIHAHVYRAGPSALKIGRLTKAPVILSEHSLELLAQQELTLEFRIFARRILERFSRILPVSEPLKKEMQKLAPKARYTVVPNAVNTELFHPASPKNRKDQRLKRILTVSLLMPVKGIPDLLKALSLLKEKRQDFILDIVGDGAGRKKLEALADACKLNGQVNFHGLRSRPEVARFMRECDFFVFPSRMETFGCVLIEAMACGKPIVATRAGNIPELVKDGTGILVPAKDPPALQAAINQMLDRSGDYSPEKIASYARDNFSYQAVTDRLGLIYREVLKEQAGQ